MAQRGRFSHNRQQRRRVAAAPPPPVAARPQRLGPAPPVEYGDPFILMEDGSKTTFVYRSGDWVTHEMSIAQCRQRQCQVKELSQKLRGMTRYEIRCPVDMD